MAREARLRQKDATVSVLLEADVTDARDIMDISIFDTLEKEWLLAPGAKLRVERIEDDPQQDGGTSAGHGLEKVYLTQIA